MGQKVGQAYPKASQASHIHFEHGVFQKPQTPRTAKVRGVCQYKIANCSGGW